VGLLSTGLTLTGLLFLGAPVAFLVYWPEEGPILGAGVTVGVGVPALILTYIGASLMVKGGRMRHEAMRRILGAPPAHRRGIGVRLGAGRFSLQGRF
jgi:hypothetical protein